MGRDRLAVEPEFAAQLAGLFGHSQPQHGVGTFFGGVGGSLGQAIGSVLGAVIKKGADDGIAYARKVGDDLFPPDSAGRGRPLRRPSGLVRTPSR